MSLKKKDNVTVNGQMSLKKKDNVTELSDEELSVKPNESQKVVEKRKRRQQAIISLIIKDAKINAEIIAERLDVNKRTILRDIKELKEAGIVERIGSDKTGEWRIVRKSDKK